MTVYVLSKMTNSVNYTIYNPIPPVDYAVGKIQLPPLPTVKRKIFIQGGADVPSYRSGMGEMHRDSEGRPLWMADGVVTPVSDSDYELLKENHVFRSHLEHGHVMVINRDIMGNNKEITKHARQLENDSFSLLTKENLKSKVKVKVGHPDEDQNSNRI